MIPLLFYNTKDFENSVVVEWDGDDNITLEKNGKKYYLNIDCDGTIQIWEDD